MYRKKKIRRKKWTKISSGPREKITESPDNDAGKALLNAKKGESRSQGGFVKGREKNEKGANERIRKCFEKGEDDDQTRTRKGLLKGKKKREKRSEKLEKWR